MPSSRCSSSRRSGRSTWACSRSSALFSSARSLPARRPPTIIDGFPGGLFLTLVGITWLFALAQNNGTIDWLVRLAVRAVQGPPRRDPVDHVPDLGAADLGRRGQPGRGRHHRPDRPRLRVSVPDLAAAHGSDGRARRPGRWLLADLDLRRHHQRRGRRGGAAAEPDDDLRVQLLRQRGGRAAALLRPRRPQAAAGGSRRGGGRHRAAHRDRPPGHRAADLRRQRGRGAEPPDRPRRPAASRTG